MNLPKRHIYYQEIFSRVEEPYRREVYYTNTVLYYTILHCRDIFFTPIFLHQFWLHQFCFTPILFYTKIFALFTPTFLHQILKFRKRFFGKKLV